MMALKHSTRPAPRRERGRSPRLVRLRPARRGIARVAIVAAIALLALATTAMSASRHRRHARVKLSLRYTKARISLPPGRSRTFTIRTKITSGSARSVAFSLGGLPAGVTATVFPASVTPGRATTLTLSTGSFIRPGRYQVRVIGSAAKRGTIRARKTAVLDVAVMPTHIATWTMDDGCEGGNHAPASLVRQWVTFAESKCGPSATKALSDCHASGLTYCTAVEYLDPEKVYAQGSLPIASSAQESWWLHQPGYTDSAHRISFSAYGGGNVLNEFDPGVDSWFHSYVQASYDSYDALLVDETVGSLSQELYPSGFQATNEIPTDAALQASHDQLATSLTHANGAPFLQIDNSLTANNNLSTSIPMLGNPPSVVGAVTEDVPEYNGILTSFYSTLLDEMAYVDNTANEFAVLLSYDTSGSRRSRRVQAATVLLGYSAGHTVSWSNLNTKSTHLAIWPEEGIVPTDPIQSMPPPGGAGCFAGTGIVCPVGGHTALEVAPGVYRREFGTCYNRGIAFGPCAAIVNTGSAPVTLQSSWLSRTYRHRITMPGGDVQSGGTVNLAGLTVNPGTTAIPATDAILLSR
jgi:hypothetical protein